MNSSEKKRAERIIALFKENDGTIDQDFFSVEEKLSETAHNIYASLRDLCNLGYVEDLNYGKYRLTEIGWEFETFEKISQNKKSAEELIKISEEKLKLEVEKLRNDFFDYSDTKKRVKRNEFIQWLSILLSAIAILTAFLTKKSG